MDRKAEPSTIQVSNPTTFKQKGKQILVYTVEGDFIKFPLIRSLSDFRLFREKLRMNWPGIIIPYLDEALQENKDETKSINEFIKELYQLKEIYTSEDFFLIFSLTPDISQTLNSTPNETLPIENRDHPLSNNWKGYRECHITPDWLLIYKHENDKLVLTLARTGSHSDLFKL